MIARRVPGPLPCWRVRRLLQSYLDGVLDDAAAGRVVRHLAGCHRCAMAAETYQAIKNSLARRRRSAETTRWLRDVGETLRDQPPRTQPPPDAEE